MLALVTAVLLASLLGSTHCAGMCGAFVAFAVGIPDKSAARRPSRFALNAAYNGGRLITYATLGLAAGALGAALDLGGSLVGIQRVAAISAAAVMIGFGAVAIMRHFGVRIPRAPIPALMVRVARAGHTRALALAPVSRALAVGLLTTLLPCGWLYAFVVIAAGTASPLGGAVVMAAFWLGTLPIMAALGLGVRTLAGPLGRRLPLATSCLLVLAGVWTIFGRMAMPAIGADMLRVPDGLAAAVRSVDRADEACPLCRSKRE